MIAAVFAAGLAPIVVAIDPASGNVQGYGANQPIDHGTIVELVDGDTRRVKAVSQADMQKMFGVVVNPQLLPVRITSEGLENEVFVASSGTYDVLVSSQGGDINPGDYITVSSLNGIGMKASPEETSVLGRAVAGFNKQSVSRGSVKIQDVNGNTIDTVRLGSVPVTIEIQRNPLEKSTKAKVPEFLERVGQAIAEKEVSAIRIYISMAITTISLITALVVLYVGVRNSIISIGRNPMSKRSIFRALIEIILTSILILVIGLFAVYLLLRL